MFALDNAVIVDTETTGLKNDGEICEIGIIDALTGEILLDTLIRPSKPIPVDATAIHGISNEDVAESPSWIDVYGRFVAAVRGKIIYAYNATFDNRIANQTCTIYNVPGPQRQWEDIMVPYSNAYGEPAKFGKDGKWQKLVNAASQQGIDVSDLVAHRAVSDCHITRRLMMHINQHGIENMTRWPEGKKIV